MRQLATIGAATLGLALGSARAGEIDSGLAEVLDQAQPGEVVSTLVYLSEQTDLKGLTQVLDAGKARLRDRHEAVILALKDTADQTQGQLLGELQKLLDDGRIERFQPFWISNAIRVDAVPAEILGLADREDVGIVYFNSPIEGIGTANVIEDGGGQQGGVAGGPEPGIVAVRAPEVWAMGITGTGRLVSSLDTGVDGNHPAVAGRWRGLDPAYAGNPEWAWFDPVTNTTFPEGWGSHGTHTMGTICGGAPGDQVGVAPGAEWIHAGVIDRVSIDQTVADAIISFEWTVDPDGDPGTHFDVPDTSSNSWGLADFHGHPDCDETFWSFLDACEAVGVVVIFSAGNEGTSGLRRPADRATDDYRTFAVAAVDGNSPGLPIASFSSRGPTQCTPGGEDAIKPDISAPGVNVRSSIIGGGYSEFSGTSMSSPHVNGVVALMREANPELGVQQIKQIIYDTAMDLGSAGEDNSYGWGNIDAFEAVQAALGAASLSITFPNGLPETFDPLGGTAIQMQVSAQNAEADPGSAAFYYRTDGGAYSALAMTPLGGDLYEAVFPALDCLSPLQYYFSIDTTEAETIFNPFNAPDSVYSGEVFTGVNVAFLDDFESDMNWTVEDSPGLTTGTWQRGDPVGGGDRGDPASDADGSGQCYVTDNVDGDFDIDNGSTTLTSPNMDATQISDPFIVYHRWYNNAAGAAPETDTMVIEVSDDGGTSWTDLEIVGPSGPEVFGGWIEKSFRIADFVNVTSTFRIRFTASDLGDGSIVEAGVDGVEISELFCDDGGGCDADVDGDGFVGVTDLVAVITEWGPCPGCPEDIDGDDEVGVTDLVAIVTEWGDCP